MLLLGHAPFGAMLLSGRCSMLGSAVAAHLAGMALGTAEAAHGESVIPLVRDVAEEPVEAAPHEIFGVVASTPAGDAAFAKLGSSVVLDDHDSGRGDRVAVHVHGRAGKGS